MPESAVVLGGQGVEPRAEVEIEHGGGWRKLSAESGAGFAGTIEKHDGVGSGSAGGFVLFFVL